MALTKVQTIGIETGISLTGVTTVTTLNASTDTLSVGGTVNFGGNVSIAGTLTYEDVTNIDSIGIITARSAIVLSDDNAIHFRGVVTDDADAILRASAGGGQLLINSRNDTIINIDSNNDSTDAHFAVAHGAATGSSTEVFRVQEDGKMGLGTNSPANILHVHQTDATANSYVHITHADGGSGATDGLSVGIEDGGVNASIRNRENGYLRMFTNNTERMRIDSSGRLLLGTTTEGNGNADDLTISSSGHCGLTIRAGTTSSNSNIYFSDGTSGADEYAGYIQFSHNGDTMKFGIQGNDALYIDSDRRLLIGSSSAISGSSTNDNLQLINSAGSIFSIASSDTTISSGTRIGEIEFWGQASSTWGKFAGISCFGDGTAGGVNGNPGRLVFYTEQAGSDGGPVERMRITSGGKIQVTGTRAGSLQASDNDSLELYTSASNGAANTGSGLTFYNNDGNGAEIGGTIQVAKENGSINNTAGYMRFSTRANASDPAERMRIGSGGDVLISRTSASISNVGHYFLAVGAFNHTRSGDTVGEINRLANDGTLIGFRQADSLEGSISVSGSTVSYNGGHLARWSQLASGAARIEILRGSVLSNLNEMCEWGEEDNEQLNRMKVSDVEGDVNVAGVFQDWDDDDDTYTNDFYCAMTGDFIIRIAQGTTVARGDLLMSAGDGTAKPQDDDIVRSKTIAKVTSTTVSTTYSDGSYCVPCVLMAC